MDHHSFAEVRTFAGKDTPNLPARKPPLLTKIRISAISLILMLSSCTVGREFRDVALPAIESGALSIATGLLEGFFAAIAVDPQTTGSGTSSQ